MRIHTLIENYTRLTDAGFFMVAFFQSTPEGIRKYVGKLITVSDYRRPWAPGVQGIWG